jgi:hypothetical protein
MLKYEVQVSVFQLKPELKKNFKLKFNILINFSFYKKYNSCYVVLKTFL